MVPASSLLTLVCEEHTKKDEGSSEEEVDGNLLREDGPSKEDGGNRIEIDVIGGDDCTQFLQYPVPG